MSRSGESFDLGRSIRLTGWTERPWGCWDWNGPGVVRGGYRQSLRGFKDDHWAHQKGEDVEASSVDRVSHPHYYGGFSNGAEVIDIAEHLNFNRGNAVKYLSRAGVKNPATEIEDLRKAEFYVKREIERLEKASG